MTDFNAKDCKALVAELPDYLREVLKQLAAGRSTKEIADALALKESTVRVYRERLYSKLHARNLAVATRIAVAAGVV